MSDLENHVALAAEQSRDNLSSTAAHTPGPWGRGRTGRDQVMLLGKNGEGRYVCQIQIMQTGGGVIAQMMEPEREANARLIAAAPDMLAALIMAENIIGQIPAGGTREPLYLTFTAVQDAIAKATGGA